MDSKIIIFIVFATVVQSSLGFSSQNYGELREEILVEESAIHNFNGAALDDWHRTVLSFHTQIRLYLETMFVGVNCSNNSMALALNRDKTFTGAFGAQDSILLAAAVVHPNIHYVLPNIRAALHTEVTGFVDLVYTAAYVARCENTTKALQRLNTMESNGVAAIPYLAHILGQALRGGNSTNPPIVEMAHQTVEENIVSMYDEAVHGYFNMIKVLNAATSLGQHADKEATYKMLETYAKGVYFNLKKSLYFIFMFLRYTHAGNTVIQAGCSAGVSQNLDLQAATLPAYSKMMNDVWKQIENDLENHDIAKRNQISTNTCGKKTQGVAFADIQDAIKSPNTSDTSEICYKENPDTDTFNVIQ